MNDERGDERCSACNSIIRTEGQKGYDPVAVPENDKEIILQHCPECGTLLIHVETIPVHSR